MTRRILSNRKKFDWREQYRKRKGRERSQEPVYVPAKDDRACMRWDRERIGKIVRAGVEVSEIRFQGERQDRCFPNEQFRKMKG